MTCTVILVGDGVCRHITPEDAAAYRGPGFLWSHIESASEDELPTARILAGRLAERAPDDARTSKAVGLLTLMETDPRRLERELHRRATKGEPEVRASFSKRARRSVAAARSAVCAASGPSPASCQ